jgi:cell division protein FtsN
MARTTSRNSGRSGGKSIFTGVMIGLIAGLVLAVAVAIWVMRSSPFKAAEPAPAEPAPAAPAAPAVPPTPEAAPSFDFYKVLPGEPQPVLPGAPSAPNTPRLYLQAGAFQNPTDADNLKASLALLGVEATIQTGPVADKGILHRVRIGPLDGMDEVERTRALLTQNNIPAVLVKELPPTEEMP